jgi:hypothetical protein
LSPLLFVLAIDPLAQNLEKVTSLGLLRKLWEIASILRTSLYVDDVMVFVASFKEDIQNLASILQGFGEVTGLCTIFLKSCVVPITYANIDLHEILFDIPATLAYFPLKYLGLPLSVWQLKEVDFQHLEDKCTRNSPLGMEIYQYGQLQCSYQVGDYLKQHNF